MKDSFVILMPTRGRTYAVRSLLNSLSKGMMARTVVCCHQDELLFWQKKTEHVLAVPCEGIGPTRQWLMQWFSKQYDCIVMLDDDLSFCTRDDMTTTKLHEATLAEVEHAIRTMVHLTGEYGSCGMSPRSGNQNELPAVTFNKRTFSAYAFNPALLLDHGIRWDRLHLMEDFYVFLSLMTRGYDVPQVNDVCFRNISNTAGGCSIYRNAANQAKAAQQLAALFPDFVRLVTKTTKHAWFEGGERTDVNIQWKKAAEFGKQNLKNPVL